MPEVIQEKPNRMPQWIALAAAVVIVLAVSATVVVLKVADSQKKAFETAKTLAINSDRHSDPKGAARTLVTYLDTKPPKKYADQLYITTATYFLNAADYDKAIEYYKKADSINAENHSKSVNGLALAYGYKGDKDAAIGYYRQLIEITKKNNSNDKMELQNLEAEIARLQEGSK
jgi:tetratricopeptide (TPR) repeat protein